jgi:type I restriction enzyme, S subunit
MIKNNENNSSTPLTSASLSTSSAGLLPKFRFPEFVKDMEWNKKMLGEIGEFSGGGTPSRDNESFWEGDIPWVSSSDIDEESIIAVKISRFISEEAMKSSAPANSILLVSRVGVYFD